MTPILLKVWHHSKYSYFVHCKSTLCVLIYVLGLLQIGGSLTYVPLISLIEEYGFSFYLSLAGGGLLVVSGIAYAVIARINRYGLKPVLPWRNKKKGMDDMDQGTEDDNTCDEAACQDNGTICDNCKDEI